MVPTAIDSMQRLARPGATLACAVCGAMLKAEHVERHLAKVHPRPAPVALVGEDRSLSLPLTVAGLVVLAAVLGAAWFWAPGRSFPGIALAAVILCLGPALLSSVGLFRARLELEGRTIRLRGRQLTLPVTIEAGRLRQRRLVPGSQQLENPPTEEVDAGGYLRLSSGGQHITLGCRAGGGLGHRWGQAGWSHGRRRTRWDLTVDRQVMLTVEYFLAEHGQLEPRH